MLVDAGADINAANAYNKSPLDLAKTDDVKQVLMDAGAAGAYLPGAAGKSLADQALEEGTKDAGGVAMQIEAHEEGALVDGVKAKVKSVKKKTATGHKVTTTVTAKGGKKGKGGGGKGGGGKGGKKKGK